MKSHRFSRFVDIHCFGSLSFFLYLLIGSRDKFLITVNLIGSGICYTFLLLADLNFFIHFLRELMLLADLNFYSFFTRIDVIGWFEFLFIFYENWCYWLIWIFIHFFTRIEPSYRDHFQKLSFELKLFAFTISQL